MTSTLRREHVRGPSADELSDRVGYIVVELNDGAAGGRLLGRPRTESEAMKLARESAGFWCVGVFALRAMVEVER